MEKPMRQPAHAVQAQALMERMALGDRLALAGLIALYGRGVRTFCTRALDIGADAEDAAQEVFLRLWASARRYDPAMASVATWTYRIALRHCIDRNRKARVRQFFGLAAVELPEAEDDSPDAFRQLAGRQDMVRVREAVRALPDRQRQALLLQVVAGMETAAIAGVMGCGTGAVEQLLVRARAWLRAQVGLDLG
jgi:RNA polymerase sigma-70 factor (ECF subfamily)